LARRRLLAILPIFVIALLAQIYAPAGSALAIGRAQAAGVLAEPCAAHGQQTPGAPHAPGAVCDLCDFVFSGAAPVAFDLPPADFTRAAPRLVSWALPARRLCAGQRRQTAQARAPPFAS